ncbi:Deleted in malignant brain tumors 1 protein, partial [Bulinus truncatus]
ASMEIYRNDTFSSPVSDNPVAVPLGEWLNMAVLMEQYDPRLMLTVTDCLATPTGNKSGSVRQILFANKCSQESTLSFYPINNFKFGFRFKPFRFVGYDLLYLHCDAIVCIATDNIKECDRTCNNTKPNATSTTGRRRRSNNNIFYTYADSQAIVLYGKEPTQTETPCLRADACPNNTYCSELPDGNKNCIACDVACELSCDGPGPERCTSCKNGYYKPSSLLQLQPCTECNIGFFGQNCLKQCHCLNNELCNKTDGLCMGWKCGRGYTGLPYCQDICPVNTFGLDCGFQCHCPVNDNCSNIQGDCSSGRCDPDWDGSGCQRSVKVTKIQLKNGANLATRIGRIEIQVDNVDSWGSICDDGWDNNDAIVACRMLGYQNGGNAVLNATYGVGNFHFLMDGAACTGDEKNLTECLASLNIDCSQASKDVEVGVECNENTGAGQLTPAPATTTGSNIITGKCQSQSPTVKLYGKQGVDGMGYVQVLGPNGQFGYVCDDSWSESAAKVVCAQLCYPPNFTAKPGIPAENKLKPVNVSIYLDNVQCSGSEATLQDCLHDTWYQSDCKKDEDELAGVQCVAATYKPQPPPVPLLSCGQGQMKAQFSRASDRNLEEKHLSVLNQSNCTDVTKSTTTDYVTITIPVDKCGTTISASMEIYRNDTFSSPVSDNPVAVPLGEWQNMAVLMEQYDPRLMLTVTDCLATPTGNKSGSVRQILFSNKCSQESTLSFYPINNFKFGFRFKPFRFVGYDLLYLHCDAIVCIATDNIKECDRTCNNTKPNATSTTGRRRRSNNNIFYTYADSQAIVLYGKEPTQTDSDTKDRIVIDSGSNEIPTTTTVHNSLQSQIHGKELSLLSENSSGHRVKFPFLQAALISLFLLAFNIFY